MRLLLISNSTQHGGGYLEHCAGRLREFLGDAARVAFVGYALFDRDAYAAKVRAAFEEMGREILPVHRAEPPATALDAADAVFVGGGNTFRLLKALYEHDLLDAIRARARDGMPYVGTSAGSNVACPTIRTTNDMPIVQPPSFDALGLVPFQINPHYVDPEPDSTHMGETRADRIAEFLEENDAPVLGLREGAMVRVEGSRAELLGAHGARLFRRGRAPQELTPGSDLSGLLG